MAGVYSIQLPVKVAYEENKGNYDGKMAEAGKNSCIHEIFFSGRL